MSKAIKTFKSIYKNLEQVQHHFNKHPEMIANYLKNNESERVKLNEMISQINQLIEIKTENNIQQEAEVQNHAPNQEKPGHKRTHSHDHLLPEMIRHPSRMFHRRVKSEHTLPVADPTTTTKNNNEVQKPAQAENPKSKHHRHHRHHHSKKDSVPVESSVVEQITENQTAELALIEPTAEQIAAIFDIQEMLPLETTNTLAEPIHTNRTDNASTEPAREEQISAFVDVTEKEIIEENLQGEEINPERVLRNNQLTKFYEMLEELRKKRSDFEQRYPKDDPHDNTKPYGAINELITTLYRQARSYEKSKTNLSEFKEASSQLITEKRRGVLGQHRGCKELLTNLLLFIGTLGIGYLLAAAITRSLNPIKVNTDSIDKINATAETINTMTM